MEWLKEEGKTVSQREEVGWVEREAKVEVGAWKCVPAIRDNCLVQLG